MFPMTLGFEIGIEDSGVFEGVYTTMHTMVGKNTINKRQSNTIFSFSLKLISTMKYILVFYNAFKIKSYIYIQ